MEAGQGETVNLALNNNCDMNLVANRVTEHVNDANDKINNLEANEDRTDAVTDPNDDNNCLVRLIFKDNATFDELHAIIGKCVRDALFLMKKSTNVIVNRNENCIKISDISTTENDESIFMVDTLPTENTNESEIPDYNSSTIGMLNDDEVESNHDESKPKTGNCWNCGGDHNMKDCKEKRDPIAINRARQTMQKMKGERYHLDNEQRYSHFVPGQISKQLREALGVRSREIPLYIYKMRLYGYPEGWLEEAKINHSGLSLFHTENKSSIDRDVEDGEVDKVTFDASKFIEYPGFNAPVPSNLIDEGDYYRVPPMQFCHSKEGLIQQLQNNLAKTYKRKRLKIDSTGKSSDDNVKNDDMDIQSGDENTKDALVQRPETRPTVGSDVDESNSTTVPDDRLDELEVSCDSLLDLKRRQEEILKALEDASNDDSNSTPSNQNDESQCMDMDTDTEPESNVAAENNQAKDEYSKNGTKETILEATMEINDPEINIKESENVQNTPSPSITGQSRSKMFGTPLIKQVSPYSKLPNGGNWSIGVTDVIDFENLPDSTGAYQKLTGVINKVRTVIKRINDENDHDSL